MWMNKPALFCEAACLIISIDCNVRGHLHPMGGVFGFVQFIQ